MHKRPVSKRIQGPSLCINPYAAVRGGSRQNEGYSGA